IAIQGRELAVAVAKSSRKGVGETGSRCTNKIVAKHCLLGTYGLTYIWGHRNILPKKIRARLWQRHILIDGITEIIECCRTYSCSPRTLIGIVIQISSINRIDKICAVIPRPNLVVQMRSGFRPDSSNISQKRSCFDWLIEFK